MKFITKSKLLGIFACITACSSALAADKNANSNTKPAKMSCEDFIALDDVVKAKVVYWAEGLNRKGKPEDAVVDIVETDNLVPVLVEECSKTPKQSFWVAANGEFKKTG
jgi:hypothetical protein